MILGSVIQFSHATYQRKEVSGVRELHDQLVNDIRKLGIKVDFELVLKNYSKSFYGRYDPNTNKVILYVYQDENCIRPYPYRELLLTVVHECCHCIQWHSPSYVRVRGVMHDRGFSELFNYYSDKANALCLLREVIRGASYFETPVAVFC
jgi:hypothetical protein